MSISPSQRGQLVKKFKRLTAAQQAAEEAVLVAIHEAVEAGATLADIAFMVGDKSSSGIRPKADKGKAIIESRKK